MSIVNHVFLSPNEGEDYLMFLALSVPGKVSRCSASVLVLLASFLNSGSWGGLNVFEFCRQCGVAGGERVPLAQLGWYVEFKQNKE